MRSSNWGAALSAAFASVVTWLVSIQVAWAQAMPEGHPPNPQQDIYLPMAFVIAGAAAVAIALQYSSQGEQVNREVGSESRRIDMQAVVAESLEALQQLEVERPKMDPTQYNAEREALLGRGASAMAVLEEAG